MMMYYWLLPWFLFMCAMLVFVSNQKHLLSMLLSLEFIVLSLFIFLLMYLNLINYEGYFSMVFLTFCVCEGVLGLSVLIMLVRTHGNDYFQSINIL
uniref:NADH-ubiquinone oxidoreductase chain 4L n=1 Tax=Psychodopygus squamiventris maripaensis TaxID=1807781 RepID=A0A343AW89_9DIPT|nr:NADH dehydrogenase subunit 4L [Psychodopygus squamiventris maripaensis]